MLASMLPSSGYQGFRTAPILSGWVQTGERWALWFNGRETACVEPDGRPGLRLWVKGQKMWQVKHARVVSVGQGRRFAERWCAARLYPGLPLREAVARLTNSSPSASSPRFQTGPMTLEERQQAQRLEAAVATASAKVLTALKPMRLPTAAKPRKADLMRGGGERVGSSLGIRGSRIS